MTRTRSFEAAPGRLFQSDAYVLTGADWRLASSLCGKLLDLIQRSRADGRLPMIGGDGNTNALIETAIRCVAMLVQNEIRTMVACSAGMSRSLGVAAATMAVVNGRSPGDCLDAIAAGAPHDVSPILCA